MKTFGYPIEIVEVLNGFVVTIGCKSIVVEGEKSFEEAIKKLSRKLGGYLRDRDAIEKEWQKRFPTKDRSSYQRGGDPTPENRTTTTTTTSLLPRR